MYKIVFLLFLVLFFGGCLGEPKPSAPKSNEKVFEEEDAYILFALRAEQIKDYQSASELFDKLYRKSGKKEYLYRSLGNDLAARKNQEVIKKINDLTKDEQNDLKLIRLKIVAFIGDGEFENARVLGISLVEKSKEVNDYLLVSEVYVKQKKYNTALKYLESAYVKDYNEKILDKISIILYVNLHRKKDAIALLETHIRMNGCSKQICGRLIGFYSNENNIDGILSTYLRMYKLNKNAEISQKIIEIYMYKKDYVKLMMFLQDSGSDDDLLLQMYIDSKNYKKAFEMAEKLYVASGDIKYLGQSAMFEYESSKDKNDVQMHKRVVDKLKKVVHNEKISLYLNYLGYLLIDHSIDVKAGMVYVKEALEMDENSAFYLDSLAWGYYRLGECEKALQIITKVRKLDGGDDPEVIKHLEAIQKCKMKKIEDKQ